jgi:Protein of unknown function (DUF3306)
MADDAGFLARWSQRKAQARQAPSGPAVPPAPEPPAAMERAGVEDVAPVPPADAVPAPPPAPTLEEARALTPESDFRRFVTPEVEPAVRHTALRQLFADPHFNRMDGLDIYIDDYGKPDPIPPAMLRKMVQSAFLNLFADEPQGPPAETPAEKPAPDEDPDLRLQPHDAAGPPGPGPGAGEDAGREP